MSMTAFLPCRQGSQRIPNKNWKRFANVRMGLIEIKLAQLLDCDVINQVVLSTDDPVILDYAVNLKNTKLTIHKRQTQLSQNTTETNELVNHALDLIPNGDILWTHVTSPFVKNTQYAALIATYYEALKHGYDSLMTTTAHQGFFWFHEQPINYDRQLNQWPRTQTLEPVHEVNSCAFISSAANYRNYNDRIGNKVKLYPMSRFEGFDIDWPEDFKLAELLLTEKLVSL
ncbi:cytidylyltransferase domain-containing protein [Aliidiomarina quisquiliarum]|uniref:acylneuraminate cytidylyltransferase family protein n=1 Tax=Aliidiomarina quisquiliarum TaxID=2938947 RepID=UPI00208FD987|nr:acylneuraminate cytidylyltransferase family protein [Aliidiomarina quisquiliarum]MCO4322066.1 acylneuraminate cytidylyltransferase family protein [Aliidiomarina quisquiliarum]